MLNINRNIEEGKVYYLLEGRLDTATAPALENDLKEILDNTTELILDMEKLEYISSAGLRVILSAQKIMQKNGSMKVKNINDTIREIFEVTGFTTILTIE